VDPHIQLLFNVLTITGVTGLGAICYLLLRDNQKLAIQLKMWHEKGPREAKVTVVRPAVHPIAQPVAHPSVPFSPGPHYSAPYESPTIVKTAVPVGKAPAPTPTTEEQNIREYVASRTEDWLALPATGDQLKLLTSSK
jgi:hypothetical protein